MNIVNLLTSRDFLIAVLAAVSAAAVVFTFGSQFFERSNMKDRIKRVALERERMRAEEMARLTLEDFGAVWVRVVLVKPGKFEDVAAVGVAIERRREPRPREAASVLSLIASGLVPAGAQEKS